MTVPLMLLSEAKTRNRSIVGRVHNKLDPQFCTG